MRLFVVLAQLLTLSAIVFADDTDWVSDDETLRDNYWCSARTCVTNVENWDTNSITTNECETDEDCLLLSFYGLQCGLPIDSPKFLDGSSIFCAPQGNEDKKYCTIGCLVFDEPPCGSDEEIDNQEGTILYCEVKKSADTNSDEIKAFCPCMKEAYCDAVEDCGEVNWLEERRRSKDEPKEITSTTPTYTNTTSTKINEE